MNDNFYVTKGGGVGASSMTAGTGTFGGGWFGGTSNIAKVAKSIEGYTEKTIDYVSSVKVDISGKNLTTRTELKRITILGKNDKNLGTSSYHTGSIVHSHSISEGDTTTGNWP